MAQLNITLSQEELLELITGNRDEAFKHLMEKILNQVMLAESSDQLKADQYERRDERTDYRNGSRERELTTRLGTLTLNVPRHRKQPFHTQLFESYKRSEIALLNTMAEMMIMGVSTRKVGKVMELICGKDFSKSTVSEVCKKLDPEIEKFRNRDLGIKKYPFLIVDATYFKVREEHSIVSKCMLIAIGYSETGEREVLYFNTADGETNESWQKFFEDLKKNGLESPLMLISDAHKSIRRAAAKVYPLTPWQRCQFHFTQNILDKAPKSYQESIKLSLRKVFDCKTLQEAKVERDHLINDFREVAEAAVEAFEEGFSDATTVFRLPASIRRGLRTSNCIERLNRELKRRSDVIGIFPNKDSLLRLMGTVIIEEHEKYSAHNVLFSSKTFSRITPAIKVELQQLAVQQCKLLEAL